MSGWINVIGACSLMSNGHSYTLPMSQDLLGVWNSTSFSLPPLASYERYEVAARACEGDKWFMYKQPAMACRSFAAPGQGHMASCVNMACT